MLYFPIHRPLAVFLINTQDILIDAGSNKSCVNRAKFQIKAGCLIKSKTVYHVRLCRKHSLATIIQVGAVTAQLIVFVLWGVCLPPSFDM